MPWRKRWGLWASGTEDQLVGEKKMLISDEGWREKGWQRWDRWEANKQQVKTHSGEWMWTERRRDWSGQLVVVGGRELEQHHVRGSWAWVGKQFWTRVRAGLRWRAKGKEDAVQAGKWRPEWKPGIRKGWDSLSMNRRRALWLSPL